MTDKKADRWRAFKDEWLTADRFWTFVAGAALVVILAFIFPDFAMLNSSAQDLAEDTAEQAVVDALAPICVAQAQNDPEYEAKVGELQDISSSYRQRTFVEEAGWANFAGTDEVNSDVVRACTQILTSSERA